MTLRYKVLAPPDAHALADLLWQRYLTTLPGGAPPGTTAYCPVFEAGELAAVQIDDWSEAQGGIDTSGALELDALPPELRAVIDPPEGFEP